MTTYLGKSCSFGFPWVPFVNRYQIMYLVMSLLRAGRGILLYKFLIIAYLFPLLYKVYLTEINIMKALQTDYKLHGHNWSE